MQHNPMTAFISLLVSWYFTFISWLQIHSSIVLTVTWVQFIPIILSSIASGLAIINYIYQIRNNSKRK